jgi:hypothetical protein
VEKVAEPIPACGAFDHGTMLLRPLAKVVRDQFRLGLDALTSQNRAALVNCADDDETAMKVNS